MPFIHLLFALLLIFGGLSASAQVIAGSFEGQPPAHYIVLYGTRGSQHEPLDSVTIADDGRFAFSGIARPAGFYQLGINGEDRVDFVIDPVEPEVELAFQGIPLQRNVNVLRSAENQRLWAYKQISRDGNAAITALLQQRAAASPLDTALLKSFDRQEMAIRGGMAKALDSLISIAPDGQFAFAVKTDRRLDNAAAGGPPSIRREFDLSNPRLLRSSAYAKAILLYLQTTPFTTEFALHRASDTLLTAAARDTACWNYTRWQLLDMFTTYGPDDVAQYLVDQYVGGPDALVPPDARLLTMAAAQMRVVNGAPAPDMILVTPGSADTLMLSKVWPEHQYTGLFFYSSTCDHCHGQMPGLVQLVSEMKPAYFHLVGIALDVTEEEFRTTLAEEKLDFPCYTELKAWGAQGAKDYNVKATPTLFVLDRQGRIRAKPMDHQELRAFLETNRR